MAWKVPFRKGVSAFQAGQLEASLLYFTQVGTALTLAQSGRLTSRLPCRLLN